MMPKIMESVLASGLEAWLGLVGTRAGEDVAGHA